MDCENCKKLRKQILDQALAEQVCPVCKGEKKKYLTPLGIDETECSVPCPACGGKGDYKSWAEKQLVKLEDLRLDDKINYDKRIANLEELNKSNMLAIVLNNEIKKADDRQIADQQALIEKLVVELQRVIAKSKSCCNQYSKNLSK